MSRSLEPTIIRWLEFAVVGLMLCLHGWLAASTSDRKSAAFDEIAHLGGGYLQWAAGDYRFNAESGVLPQRWATVPWAGLDVPLPAVDDPRRRAANVWAVGRELVYGGDRDHALLLRRSRTMIAVLGMALAGLVYLLSRSVFGVAAGMLSLTLIVFSPTVLAHSGLATADVAAALFFLLATSAIWWLLPRVTLFRVSLAIFAVAGLLLSKMSGLLIAPIAAVMVVVYLMFGRPVAVALGKRELTFVGWRRLSLLVGVAALGAVLVGVTIWGAYGFRYRATSDQSSGVETSFLHSWRTTTGAGVSGLLISSLRAGHVLPEAYLWGLDYTLDTTRERDAFANGKTSSTGWWWFFPYAFVIKTPLGLFAILTLAWYAAWSSRRSREWGFALVPMWALASVYGVVAMSSGLNIGHRHLLPIYPALFVMAGGAAVHWLTPRTKPAGLCTLVFLGWFISSSVMIRPHYLAFFNGLVGGPSNGYRHLVDSSLDWGQELPALAERLRDISDQPVFVGFFGSAPPGVYGVEARWLSSYFPLADPQRPPQELEAGVYCVSATVLQSLHQDLLGPWTVAREARYQDLRNRVARFRRLRTELSGAEQLAEEGSPQEWMAIFSSYERLRSGRLFRYLRQREPDEQLGYAINVYDLRQAELRSAVYGSPPDL